MSPRPLFVRGPSYLIAPLWPLKHPGWTGIVTWAWIVCLLWWLWYKFVPRQKDDDEK